MVRSFDIYGLESYALIFSDCTSGLYFCLGGSL